MVNHRSGLTERITYAEDWLDRARRQIEDGDIGRGTLTLILAEAEVHRAREVTMSVSPTAVGAPEARGLRTANVAFAVMTAAFVLVAVSMAALQPKAPVAVDDVASVPIVRLPAGTGDMLRMVMAPDPVVERTVERRIILRVPVAMPARDDRPTAPVLVVPTAAAPVVSVLPPPAAAVAPMVLTAPVSVPVVAPAPAPTVLNEADVIDLVLAAERSLRRSAKQ